MTTSPTQPNAALDPMVQELIVAAMDLQECQRTSTARELSSKMNDLSRQLTERLVKPQYSLDAGYLKVEMAKVGITDEDQAANAARIVLAALTPAPPVSVPADHVTVSWEDIHKRIYNALDQLPYLMVPKITMTADEYIKRIATDITAALAADQADAG